MHITNQANGRDIAACMHIILTPDVFVYVSESVSPNILRRAFSSSRGVQLKDMSVGMYACMYVCMYVHVCVCMYVRSSA